MWPLQGLIAAHFGLNFAYLCLTIPKALLPALSHNRRLTQSGCTYAGQPLHLTRSEPCSQPIAGRCHLLCSCCYASIKSLPANLCPRWSQGAAASKSNRNTVNSFVAPGNHSHPECKGFVSNQLLRGRPDRPTSADRRRYRRINPLGPAPPDPGRPSLLEHTSPPWPPPPRSLTI